MANNMANNKETFIKVYRQYITREGSDGLLSFLEESDFFTAPASSRYHLNVEGGLCLHSLNVFKELIRLLKAYPEIKSRETGGPISTETLAVVSLLHDICKVNTYKVSTKNVKDEVTGKWHKEPFFKFEEDFSFGGHGSKSVYLIMKYMDLTPEEAVAINCHMGTSTEQSVAESYKQYPLAWALHVADEAAAYIVEVSQ